MPSLLAFLSFVAPNALDQALHVRYADTQGLCLKLKYYLEYRCIDNIHMSRRHNNIENTTTA